MRVSQCENADAKGVHYSTTTNVMGGCIAKMRVVVG